MYEFVMYKKSCLSWRGHGHPEVGFVVGARVVGFVVGARFLVDHASCGVINVWSCVILRPLTPLLGVGLPCIVFIKDHMVRDVMEGVSSNVDKFEVLFHLS